MSTRDTQMNQYLTTIAEAVHGRDMRAAIHDGLEKTYNDAYSWFDESLGNANQALQKSTEALDIAGPMGDDIQEIKDLAEDLDTRYDETNERVNNIIAHNQDTQGNSELIDLRTTYDGQVKTSAGSAVRSQISNLHSRINNLVREQSTGELDDCHAKPVYVALYENQYPSSAFAAQTLQLSLPGSPAPSLEKYAFIKITFKDSNLFGAGVRSVYIPNPGKDAEATNIYTSDGHVTMPADGTYGINSYSRKFTAALSSNDTVLNIMFTDCEKIATDNPFAIEDSDMTISDPSSTATTDNNYLIPYEVFLIDYVLDGEIEIDKDTELIDIRNGEDGTTYQSAGAAVRGQVVSAKNKTASTQSMIAPLYSVSGTYAAGDYVNYGDKLYKAKQAISSEAWTASHWQEVNVMDEVDSNVGELKSDLTLFEEHTGDFSNNLFPFIKTDPVQIKNTAYGDYDNGVITISGTVTSSGGRLVHLVDKQLTAGTYTVISTSFPSGVSPYINFNVSGDNRHSFGVSGYTFTLESTANVWVSVNLSEGTYNDSFTVMLVSASEPPTEVLKPLNGAKDTVARAKIDELKSRFSGKKWVCVGDSLTAENSAASKHYFDYVTDYTGITIVNMGNSGSGYREEYDINTAFYQRIEASMPSDANVVTIFGSGNDIGHSDSSGRTWDQILGSPTDTDNTTICGCINLAIDAVYTKAPLVRLGIVLPTPWKTAWDSTNHRLADSTDTASPLRKWYKYTNALITICKNRGIPYLDLFRESSLRPWDASYRALCYSNDGNNGVHPDNTGHSIIAPLFMEFLDKIMLL